MSSKPKFKVGDKVKILPSAINVAVWKEEIGKIGRVVCVYDFRGGSQNLYVKMLNPCRERLRKWSVSDKQISLTVDVGQQFMFSFMEEKR